MPARIAKKKLTEFQEAILAALARLPMCQGQTWELAAMVRPEKWRRAACRGGLVANVRRAAYNMPELVHVLPGKDRWEPATVALIHKPTAEASCPKT
jgi:hypothetical protein